MEERRRSPRRVVIGIGLTEVPAAASVRVIDISAAGVLLQSTRRMDLGSTGCLRFALAGAPFAANIQVQRVLPAPETSSAYRIGATFMSMTLEHRQLLERFIDHD
jgi:hypothetical protein